MEPIFESYTPDFTVYVKKIYRFLVFTAPAQIVKLCTFAAFWFAMLLYALYLLIFYHDPVVLIVDVIGVLATAGLLAFSYFRGIRLYKARLKEISGGRAPDQRVVVTSENLTFSDHPVGNGTPVPFDVIAKVYDRKELIFLKTKSKLLYTIPKNSFVCGTPEGLLGFLQAKGVKIS